MQTSSWLLPPDRQCQPRPLCAHWGTDPGVHRRRRPRAGVQPGPPLVCAEQWMQTLVCPPQGPPSRLIPRAPTHRGDRQGPSPPGARTRSPGALSRDADSGAWWAVPSPLPEAQPGAFPAGDTVPPPLALPPEGSPACHSAKAVGTQQGISINQLGREGRGRHLLPALLPRP